MGVGARVLERSDISNITFHSVDVLVFRFHKKIEGRNRRHDKLRKTKNKECRKLQACDF